MVEKRKPDTRNIVLVGFMGTGKTVVGRALSSRLMRRFVDMDERIEEREQKKISTIFDERGEDFFRRLERDLVQELAQENNLVIACGGGIVLNPDNIDTFAGSGLVICLQAAPDVILRRVARQQHRPLLEEGDKRESIQRLYAERKPLYDAIPLQIDRTHLGIQETVDKIIQYMKESEGRV